MSFYQKYELDRLIADGETKTFRAKETATGRLVFLHLFNPEAHALLEAIKNKFAKDPLHPTPPLIALGEFAGGPFVVTEPVTPFTTLRDWLGKLPEGPQEPLPVTAEMPVGVLRPAPPPPSKGDEFERLFDKPKPAEDDPFARLFDDPKPAAQPRAKMGEFTKIFGSGGPKAKPHPPAPANQRPPTERFLQLFGPTPGKPAAPVKSEETKKFRVPTPPPARSPFPPADTGQFGSLFGPGPAGESINIEEEQARAAKSGQPESRPFQAPSEFTKVFGPQGGSSRPLPPPRPHTIGSASGIFRGAQPPNLPMPVRVPSAGNAEKDPGEYTQIIARGQNSPPAGAQLVPVAPPKRGLMIGITIFIVVLVVVIIVVIVMAMQKH